MHMFLTLAALLIAAPVVAQAVPPGGAAMPRDHAPAPAAPMQRMDDGKMKGMDHGKMGGMGSMGEMMKNTPANPYAEAGMAMHRKMMVVGADASETWARQMIEHHRGAIAMSKIAVAQAGDKDVRTMAQRNITMQEKDVADLQSWLKQHGKAAQ